MNQIMSRLQLNQPGQLSRLTLLISLPLVLGVMFLGTGNLFNPFSGTGDPERVKAVEAAIEDQYGIHLTMLAVTAGGGVVDFRFQVVDPEKANNYMHGPYEDLPILIEEKTNTRINPREHTHHSDYEFGRSYYQIYRNPGGVVEPGSQVTVILGDLSLNHIIVR